MNLNLVIHLHVIKILNFHCLRMSINGCNKNLKEKNGAKFKVNLKLRESHQRCWVFNTFMFFWFCFSLKNKMGLSTLMNSNRDEFGFGLKRWATRFDLGLKPGQFFCFVLNNCFYSKYKKDWKPPNPNRPVGLWRWLRLITLLVGFK